MRIRTLPVCLALAAAVVQAHAADDRFYLAPSVNYTFADSDRQADDDWGLGLALGKPVSRHWNLELALSGASLNMDSGGGEYDLIGLGVDAVYLVNRDADFTPYGVVGVGALRTDIPGSDDVGVAASAGVGVLKRLTENVALRADARYRWDDNAADAFNEDNFGDWIVGVGLTIALGKSAQAAPAPQAAVEPVPAPEPAPAAPEPAAEPAPALQTEQAAQLERSQAGDVVVLPEGVNFAFDSAELRPDAVTVLDEAVTVLNRRTDIKVDVVGHTCNIGPEAYNQGLSERRAKSVYDYFIDNGVAADRLTTQGYGETRPAYSNDTREGREKNRRVELHVK